MRSYVLCRTMGGLNDTLVQIGRCFDYCVKFGRSLVVDTRLSGLMGDFEDYFDLTGFPIEVISYSKLGSQTLNRLTAWPASVQGVLGTYRAIGITGVIGLFESESLQKLTFDMNFEYSQSVLLHHSGGGGEISRSLMKHLRFSTQTREEVQELIGSLPELYDAVHIRNTDYQSNWREFLLYVARRSDEACPVVVFSDDPAVLEGAPAISPIFQPSRFFDFSGVQGPIHKFEKQTANEARRRVVQTLAEVIAMCCSRTFYFSRTRGRTGSPKSPVSGFSALVKFLRSNPAESDGLLRSFGVLPGQVKPSLRIYIFREEIIALNKYVSHYVRAFRGSLGRIIVRNAPNSANAGLGRK